MSKNRGIRSFDYVNHAYVKVRDLLKENPQQVMGRATKSAADRAEDVAVQLHVQIAGIEVGKEVDVFVQEVAEDPTGGSHGNPITRIKLEWKAKQSQRLFPMMHAELSIYPLTATETQLDLSGEYDPPLGFLGKGVDAVVGHRIAEASMHHFVAEIAQYLRKTLG